MSALEILQSHVGGCREWMDKSANRCGAPAEYVLWGKLIPMKGLGPRCYDHAAKHVGQRALARGEEYALINLRELAEDLEDSL